jgi:hypothetical protein
VGNEGGVAVTAGSGQDLASAVEAPTERPARHYRADPDLIHPRVDSPQLAFITFKSAVPKLSTDAVSRWRSTFPRYAKNRLTGELKTEWLWNMRSSAAIRARMSHIAVAPYRERNPKEWHTSRIRTYVPPAS